MVIKTERLAGIDAARGIAVLGMILVNFLISLPRSSVPAWTLALHGRFAPMFLLLFGLCRVRSSRPVPDLILRAGLFLGLGAGVTWLGWPYDILITYSLFSGLNLLLQLRSRSRLWLFGSGVFWLAGSSVWLYWHGMSHVFFPASLFLYGSFAAFPYYGFVLIGAWLGTFTTSQQWQWIQRYCGWLFFVIDGWALLGMPHHYIPCSPPGIWFCLSRLAWGGWLISTCSRWQTPPGWLVWLGRHSLLLYLVHVLLFTLIFY